MHRWSILIIVQRDATQSSIFIILQVHSTCSGCQPHPSSGVHKTVTTASGTGHIFCAATSLHVEWTGRIINILLCAASRWIIINIFFIIVTELSTLWCLSNVTTYAEKWGVVVGRGKGGWLEGNLKKWHLLQTNNSTDAASVKWL